MPAILATPPATEPLTLANTKNHLKVETTTDDDLIARLIVAARQHVESQIDKVLIEQRWLIFIDDWPGDSEVKLPVSPISAIENLRTYSDQDDASIIDPAHYYSDLAGSPQRLILRGSRIWLRPGRIVNGIEIEVTAGFGPDGTDVPGPLRTAMLLLIAHWYENRQPACTGAGTGTAAGIVTGRIQSLLCPYKKVRL